MSRPSTAAFALSVLTLAAVSHAQTSDAGRPAKPAERTAAIASIQAQLKAFARDDYKTAATYQSSGLQKNFASPLQFRAMMTRVYPEFAHSKRAVFGPAQADATGTHLAVPIAVTGQDGITINAVYLMVREGKLYKVEGVAGGAITPPSGVDIGPSKDV